MPIKNCSIPVHNHTMPISGELCLAERSGGSHMQVGSFLGAEAWWMKWVGFFDSIYTPVILNVFVVYPIWHKNPMHVRYMVWSQTVHFQGFEAPFTPILSALRKPILELHERFECGGGWGLERTFNRWVCSQPWRKIMPMDFFEPLSQIAQVLTF